MSTKSDKNAQVVVDCDAKEGAMSFPAQRKSELITPNTSTINPQDTDLPQPEGEYNNGGGGGTICVASNVSLSRTLASAVIYAAPPDNGLVDRKSDALRSV
ncbi:hypothetical protein Trydic_g3820 [Trypoxylus dichotomus]